MTTLTPEQLQVIAHKAGHARVIAVAGAGKTTTLTHFIAARLQEGVAPRRMLVLMYNRAAREDFEQKLQRLLPRQPLPEIRTFHSLGLRIYQRLISQGLLPQYQPKFLSDSEIEPLLWRMLQQLADEETRQDILSQRKKWVETALNFIELVKAGLDSPEQVFTQSGLPKECQIFVPLFHQFEQWRKRQQRISYADMLYDPIQLFMRDEALAAQFGGHMGWILVDEYQDINAIQQQLLHILHGKRGSVMVIGDPDQTIYEFRGSRPEFIVQNFQQQMQQVSDYQLPHSFRYGHQLSLVANHLISHNSERAPVLCLSHDSTPCTEVTLHETENEVATQLTLIREQALKRPLEDIAVIHRLWALSAPLELALLQANIPYQLQHSQSVLDRWELHIFWLLLEMAAGQFQKRSPQQRYEAWLHILTTPYPKVKRALLEHIAQRMALVDDHWGEALAGLVPDELSRWQAQQLLARAEVISDAELMEIPAHRLLQSYVDSAELIEGIRDSAFSSQQVEERLQTIRAFIRFMRDSQQTSVNAWDYLQSLKAQRLAQKNQAGRGVHLTSIHKSKGLEWPVVLIPGFNAQYFPYAPEGEFSNQASEESERRLLYVAMTRAQHQLHVLAPKRLMKPSAQANECPSRFKAECCFEHSQAIAQAIEQQREHVELNPLHGPSAPWWQHYCARVGQKLSITMADLPQSAMRKALLGYPPERNTLVAKKFNQAPSGRVVHHVELGEGQVVSETERHIKIRFGQDSQARTFDKAIVASLLTEKR